MNTFGNTYVSCNINDGIPLLLKFVSSIKSFSNFRIVFIVLYVYMYPHITLSDYFIKTKGIRARNDMNTRSVFAVCFFSF